MDWKVNRGGSRRRSASRRATAALNHRRKRIKERTLIQRISDRINSSPEEDQGEDLHPEDPRPDQLIDGGGSRRGPSSRGSATGQTNHRKRIKERSFIQRISDRINSSTEEDQGVDLHRQRIQKSFCIERQRKGGNLTRHKERQNLKYHPVQVVYLLTFKRLINQKAPGGWK